MIVSVSAIVFTFLTGIVIIFQGCLAAGLPWGAASMGGRYPGKYPPRMRVVAVINMIILAVTAILVLAESGLMFHMVKPVSNVGIWIIVVFFALGTLMNTITPSKIERIWAPVALLQMVSSLIVALG